MIPEPTRTRIVSAIMAYDRRRENKPGYSRYAMPQYLGALQTADRRLAAGDTLRVALTSSFIDRLLDAVLKAAGETPSTRDECRGWGPPSRLRE